MNIQRKAIGKKLRFTVFSRDNFTCRYCGRQSDAVQLVIDHVIPVCTGGTNDIENLVTSCIDCNSGKGGRTPDQAVPNESDRLRLFQENQEQKRAFRQMADSIERRKSMKNLVTNFYCETRNKPTMNTAVLGTLLNLVDQHGHEPVFNWIELAAGRLPDHSSDVNFVKYICGIRRRMIERKEIQVNQ